MRKRCILALFAAVFWLSLVTSAVGETRIEVDENGDEYELKRFFIQGRQLSGSGSKSQCVVTRRRRSSRAVASPNLTVSSQKLSINTLPAGVPEHREGALVLPGQDSIASNKRRYVALAAVHGLINEEDDDDEEFDENAEDDEEQDAVAEAVQQTEQQSTQKKQVSYAVPLSQATPVAASHLPEGISVVASGATHANVVGNAGIVLVESDQPPKVNPNTHAVFELKPLKQKQQHRLQQKPQPQADFAFWAEDYEDEEENEDGDEDEDGDEFEGDVDVDEYFYYGQPDRNLAFYEEQAHYMSEQGPIISSAFWSSDGDEADAELIKQKKKKKSGSRRKPAKKSKNKRKQQADSQKKRRPAQEQDQDMDVEPAMEQQIKRKKQQQGSGALAAAGKPKPAKKPATSAASGSAPAKKKQQRRRPKPEQVQQQKRRKNRPSNNGVSNNRRKRPSSSNTSSALSPLGGYNRRRLTQQEQQQKRRRQQQQKRRRQEQQRRRRIRNKNRNQNDNDQYFGSEPIINCIYINKDPAPTPSTTTQRSVWNLLGRDANEKKNPAASVTPNPLSEANAAADADAESQPEQAPLPGMRRSGDFGHRKRTTLRFVGSQE